MVSHTHWDREWYQPASVFRQRLIPLIDSLLASGREPRTPFLLDGQAIVLADYLAVRPEQRDRLHQRLISGELEAGPWYVLADNLIPSGEAIIRNLQAGARVMASFGVAAPQVAYCPDSFGHPAMMPAIAHGFQMKAAIVWRGLGGPMHPRADTVRWVSPDSSSVVAYHLPPDGYEVGSGLPIDTNGAEHRWRQLAAMWRQRNATGVVLLPHGADHHARQIDTHLAAQLLGTAAQGDDARVEQSSLTDFTRAMVDAVGESDLPCVHGELRNSYGYTWTLQGTFGTRAAQKRRNARLERGLLCDVEPWLVLAWLHGGASAHAVSPAAQLSLSQLVPLLNAAWEAVLRTHPHDTLCGCSTDDVARAMDVAQRDIGSQTRGLRDAAMQLALGHDAVRARERVPLVTPAVVVRNRSARARSGVAELLLIDTLADVHIGPRSAASGISRPVALTDRADGPVRFRISDVATQSLGRSRVEHHRRESPQHYPDDDLVRVQRVLAWVPQVPAFGARVFGTDLSTDHVATAAEGPPTVRCETSGGAIVLDNGHLRVECSADGVTILADGRVLSHALTLDTTTDAGDSYTSSLRGMPRSLKLVRVNAGANGPLRASVRLRWVIAGARGGDRVPTDIESATGFARASRRRRESIVVDTELSLDAGAPHVRCVVRGWNRCRDQKLRIRWHTDVLNGVVRADAAFGPVERIAIPESNASLVAESPPSTMPLHRWVSLANDRCGVALISDGLAEVSVDAGDIAVTLVRAIGELSRGDLPERPGHAGWPCQTPASQSLGRFRASFALMPHGVWNSDALDRVEQASDDVLVPLTGESWRDYAGASRSWSGPTLSGATLRATAVTVTQDGTALLLRVSNVSDDHSCGEWIMPDEGPWDVQPCLLDETPLGDGFTAGQRIALTVGPRALYSVRVRRAM